MSRGDEGREGARDDAARTRLPESLRGREYWRSVEELAASGALADPPPPSGEVPATMAPAPIAAFDRREFLKLMGASMALAGVSACARQPLEEILPYVRAPEEIVPGKPLFFASAAAIGGIGAGILVESHMGRPTKIEGNPDHPASLGATDALTQASVLSLYDPDRSQTVLNAGAISTWSKFLGVFRLALQTQRETGGAGLRILTETVGSPTLARQLREVLAQFPNARWHQYEPAGRDNARAGARLAFGEAVSTHYRLDDADVILSLDADFLTSGPGALRYARQFAARRRVGQEGDDHARGAGTQPMNRLYAVECTPTLSGAMADHRIALRPADIVALAQEILAALGGPTAESRSGRPPAVSQEWLSAVVDDLQSHRGRSAVIAGDYQPAALHALAHAINERLGNTGRTVIHTEPVEAEPTDQGASLAQLVNEMNAGQVGVLVIIGGNPAYSAPADLGFADAAGSVDFTVHLSPYYDETGAVCRWHVPEAHFLEAWSDIRGFDGTASIVQPLIAPLYGGKSAHELLAIFTDRPDRSGYDAVRETWKGLGGDGGFDAAWRRAVHDGVVDKTAFAPKTVALGTHWIAAVAAEATRARGGEGELDIIFRPDPTVFDGRYANNGWLQELPKPLTKLTWDNAALMSPATAERLGLRNEELVELTHRDRTVEAPVWIVAGHPDDAVTTHLGYGRSRAGRVAEGAGFNAYAIRPSDAPWNAPGLRIRPTGRHYPLATTQTHHRMEGRDPVRGGTIAEFEHDSHFAHHGAHEIPADMTLYPDYEYNGNSWGMVIDLGACTGCNACLLACQSENNIPIVGKKDVKMGREMHWIRLDRYYTGPIEAPRTVHQPIPCMHCENAPCEVVCPVNATVHGSEGLNEMVYNRCVGTRYCANNCPYKVRRFNFFQYAEQHEPSLTLLANPDVTVRNRGVMEKCTYCVQRINLGRIQAKLDGREIRDGDVVTACQAVCPSGAITFGNLNDETSKLTRLRKSPLHYGLLSELNTRPRTTYLAAIRNPNPRLEREQPDAEHPTPGGDG